MDNFIMVITAVLTFQGPLLNIRIATTHIQVCSINFETIDNLIETGNSEQIFANAIHGQGRGQIIDTLAEIQERADTVKEIEKKLYELQQMFMDLSVLVESQGDLLDDIETQVLKAVDHVDSGMRILKKGKKLQRDTRKYACIAVIIFLLVIIITLGALLKEVMPWSKRT